MQAILNIALYFCAFYQFDLLSEINKQSQNWAEKSQIQPDLGLVVYWLRRSKLLLPSSTSSNTKLDAEVFTCSAGIFTLLCLLSSPSSMRALL